MLENMENPTKDTVTGENAAADENKTQENGDKQSESDNTKSVQTEDLVAIIVTTEQKNMLDSIYRLRLDHEVTNLIKQKEQSTANRDPEICPPIIIDDDDDDNDDSEKVLANNSLVTDVISNSNYIKNKLLYIMKRRYEIQKDYMYINSIDPSQFKPFEMPETSMMITKATQTRDGESYNDVQVPKQDASHLPTATNYNMAFSGLPQTNRFEQENLQDYNTREVQPTTSYPAEVQVPTEESLAPKQHGMFPRFQTNMPVCKQGQYCLNPQWSYKQTQNIRSPNAEQQHVSSQHGFLQQSAGHQEFPQHTANSYDGRVLEKVLNQQTQTRLSINPQVQSLIQQRPSHLLASQQRLARPLVNQQSMSQPSLSQQSMRLSQSPVNSQQIPQRSVKEQTASHQVHLKRPIDQHNFKLPERPVSKRGKSGPKNQKLEREQIRVQQNAWGYQPDANYPNCNWTTEGSREEQGS